MSRHSMSSRGCEDSEQLHGLLGELLCLGARGPRGKSGRVLVPKKRATNAGQIVDSEEPVVVAKSPTPALPRVSIPKARAEPAGGWTKADFRRSVQARDKDMNVWARQREAKTKWHRGHQAVLDVWDRRHDTSNDEKARSDDARRKQKADDSWERDRAKSVQQTRELEAEAKKFYEAWHDIKTAPLSEKDLNNLNVMMWNEAVELRDGSRSKCCYCGTNKWVFRYAPPDEMNDSDDDGLSTTKRELLHHYQNIANASTGGVTCDICGVCRNKLYQKEKGK